MIDVHEQPHPAPGRPACFHELVEAQVERTPEAIALIFEEQRLAYRELNRRANRLAGHLRALGVGPEHLVGLCLERSPELAVAALAVLKAGGAYLPIDPAWPAERVLHVLRDARAAVLLGAAATLKSLPELPLPVLDLEAESFADEKLQAVLDEIELRARVELAKLELSDRPLV